MLTIFWLAVCILSLRRVDAQVQKIAPGVPPQHYQQQQVHQQIPQHQIPQQQQQQVHQQIPQHQIPQQQQVYQQPQEQQFQQQIPVQHVDHQQQMHHQQQIPQQHIPQQQIPQHQENHGHQHVRAGNILNPENLDQEAEHMQEHLGAPIDSKKMDQNQLQYHYFKMHDADHNNKLDGCELIKSLIHWHVEQQGKDHAHEEPPKLFSDEEFEQLIDPILQMDDTNQDGYIDYPEFVQAQKKAAASGQQ